MGKRISIETLCWKNRLFYFLDSTWLFGTYAGVLAFQNNVLLQCKLFLCL